MRMKNGVGPTSWLALTVTMEDSPGDTVVGLAAAVVVITNRWSGASDGGLGLGGAVCADAAPARTVVMPTQRPRMATAARVRPGLCPVRKRGLSNGALLFRSGFEGCFRGWFRGCSEVVPGSSSRGSAGDVPRLVLLESTSWSVLLR